MSLIKVDPSQVKVSIAGEPVKTLPDVTVQVDPLDHSYDLLLDLNIDQVTESTREMMRQMMRQAALRRATRVRAMTRLWQQVVKDVVVRHPDPLVTVVLSAEVSGAGDQVYLCFDIKNVCDTGDPKKRFPYFLHSAWLDTWPGSEAAKMYIAAAWALYLQHEAFELVTTAEKRGCGKHVGAGRQTWRSWCPQCCKGSAFINAHGQGLHQDMLQTTLHHVDEMLAWAMGKPRADGVLAHCAERAKLEVDNEAAYVEGLCPVDQ